MRNRVSVFHQPCSRRNVPKQAFFTAPKKRTRNIRASTRGEVIPSPLTSFLPPPRASIFKFGSHAHGSALIGSYEPVAMLRFICATIIHSCVGNKIHAIISRYHNSVLCLMSEIPITDVFVRRWELCCLIGSRKISAKTGVVIGTVNCRSRDHADYWERRMCFVSGLCEMNL